MSNENWTKGGWKVKQGHSPSIIDVDCNGRMNITIVTSATDVDFQHGMERKANANLIAAAPDMYEALKVMLVRFGDDFLNEADYIAVKIAKEALAKARGEHE